jgi:hypothetical protein
MVNIPPIKMYIYSWWFGGWFIIVLPTLQGMPCPMDQPADVATVVEG